MDSLFYAIKKRGVEKFGIIPEKSAKDYGIL